MIATADNGGAYERHKQRTAERQKAQRAVEREVSGKLLKALRSINRERRLRGATDLPYFLKTYFPDKYKLPWSRDHERILGTIQAGVQAGDGLSAIAMPRGSGKTSICEGACLWAILYGFHRMVMLVAATGGDAKKRLQVISSGLTFNDAIAADFPEICVVLREVRTAKQKRPLFLGEDIPLVLRAEELTIPWLFGFREWCAENKVADDGIGLGVAMDAHICVAGITGAIRGRNHTRKDGSVVRPSLALVDDPQTRESAGSVPQRTELAEIIQGDVLGLAGPEDSMACLMPCTIIQPGDLAAEFTDRTKHPDWRGEVTKAIYAWPTNDAFWTEYQEVREQSLSAYGDIRLATKLYRDRQAEADEGCVVAWPEKVKRGFVSAVQELMDLRYRMGEGAFAAEYQNEPLTPDQGAKLTPAQIFTKVNRVPRRSLPPETTKLVCFQDVQDTVLYWMVAAFWDGFSGAVVDYGVWPEQRSRMFALPSINERGVTLERYYGKGVEGSLFAGLKESTDRLLGQYGGGSVPMSRMLIDAKDRTDLVFQFCSQSGHPGVVMPRFGRGVRAADNPLTDRKRKQGETIGLHWFIRTPDNRRLRTLTYDTNYWKSETYKRLAAPMGGAACISLFGDESDQWQHEILASHILAEDPVENRVESKDRTVVEWRLRPHEDNHWWDCLVGCAVAASEQGIALREVAGPRQSAPRKRLSLSEMQNRAAGR